MSDNVGQARSGSDVKIEVRVPWEMKARIVELAQEEHRDLSKQVRYMLEQALERAEMEAGDAD